MNRRWRKYRCVLLFVVAPCWLTCDNGPSEPVAGVVDAMLVSPAGIEGAVVLELTGDGIGAVHSARGDLFTATDGRLTRVVIVLQDPGIVRFTVQLADVAALPKATVIEVADGADQLRTDLNGYRVEFSR